MAFSASFVLSYDWTLFFDVAESVMSVEGRGSELLLFNCCFFVEGLSSSFYCFFAGIFLDYCVY